MQVHIVFHDGRPIPLIRQEVIDLLIEGMRGEIKRDEKRIKFFWPWIYRLERARKIHSVFERIIKSILNTRDASIVMVCGDTYESLVPFTSFVGDNDALKNRYSLVPIPYVQEHKRRHYFPKDIMRQEWDNLASMMRPGYPLCLYKKEDVVKEGSMYTWGNVRIDTVMQAQACFYDTPILSAVILRDLFRWMWSVTFEDSGSSVKPILFSEACTLRNEQGDLPLRWQPMSHTFENAQKHEPCFVDPYYYEAHFSRLLNRLAQYRFPFGRMYMYYASQAKNAIEEALFFSRWASVVGDRFSCNHLEYQEIDT